MRRWMKLVSGALGLALVLSAASVAQAQSNAASINANATVLRPISIVGDNDLGFGTVFPGLNKTVAISDPGAGHWSISGETGAEVDLTFALPVNLVSGGNTLPIVFGAGTAGYNATDVVGGATTFDPSAGATTSLSGLNPGELYVWIGGQVQPALNQPAGAYTETITLTIDYTGT